MGAVVEIENIHHLAEDRGDDEEKDPDQGDAEIEEHERLRSVEPATMTFGGAKHTRRLTPFCPENARFHRMSPVTDCPLAPPPEGTPHVSRLAISIRSSGGP